MRNPNLNILDSAKKKKFIDKISSFGIKKIPYLLIQTGKERIVAYSGSFSREEISKICQLLSVEGIGLYFAKDTDEGMRLSLDGLQYMKDQLNGNVIDISTEQEKDWFLGKPLELTEEQNNKYEDMQGFVVIRSGEDILGTGRKSRGVKIINNFLPKERRVRS
jgi:NOL1/NOP2/fmu family ribosome biogenesis protein